MKPFRFEKQPSFLDGLRSAAIGILVLFGIPGAMYLMLSSEMEEYEQFRKDGIVLDGIVEHSYSQMTTGRVKRTVYKLDVKCASATPSSYTVDGGMGIAPGTPIKIRYSPTLQKAKLEVHSAGDDEEPVKISTWQKIKELGWLIGVGVLVLGYGCYMLFGAYAYFSGNYVVVEE